MTYPTHIWIDEAARFAETGRLDSIAAGATSAAVRRFAEAMVDATTAAMEHHLAGVTAPATFTLHANQWAERLARWEAMTK